MHEGSRGTLGLSFIPRCPGYAATSLSARDSTRGQPTGGVGLLRALPRPPCVAPASPAGWPGADGADGADGRAWVLAAGFGVGSWGSSAPATGRPRRVGRERIRQKVVRRLNGRSSQRVWSALLDSRVSFLG